MRDLHPDFATAVATSEISPAILTFLDFEGQPLRAWTGLGPLEWNGEIFLGLGHLADVAPLEEYSEIRAGSLELTLSKVPTTALSDLRTINFKRRTAEIYLALFTADTRELIGVELLLRGTMDTLRINRGPTESTIRLTIANELAKLKKSWSSLYTDAHQRTLHPEDTGLRFVASMQDLTIRI